jgi:hypothetical protein
MRLEISGEVQAGRHHLHKSTQLQGKDFGARRRLGSFFPFCQKDGADLVGSDDVQERHLSVRPLRKAIAGESGNLGVDPGGGAGSDCAWVHGLPPTQVDFMPDGPEY